MVTCAKLWAFFSQKFLQEKDVASKSGRHSKDNSTLKYANLTLNYANLTLNYANFTVALANFALNHANLGSKRRK